jgi:hypothetical protein
MSGKETESKLEDFSEEVLSDLLNEGYEGDDLKKKFAERKAMMAPAVDSLIEEARRSKPYDSLDDMLEDASGKG